MNLIPDDPPPRWDLANVNAIPGTGRRSACIRDFLRRPRNIGAKRSLLAVFDTLRGVDVPPSNWDDIPRSHERNWKKFRLTRWKEPKHAN